MDQNIIVAAAIASAALVLFVGALVIRPVAPIGYSNPSHPELDECVLINPLKYFGFLLAWGLALFALLYDLNIGFSIFAISRFLFWIVLLIIFEKKFKNSSDGHVITFVAISVFLIADYGNFNIVLAGSKVLVLFVICTWNNGVRNDDPELNREVGASIYSRITISWINDLIKLGAMKPLSLEDVWQPYKADSSQVIVGQWNGIRSGNLISDLLKANAKYFLLQYFLAIFVTLSQFAAPYFLYKVLGAIENGVSGIGLLPLISALFIFSVIRAILESNTIMVGARASTRVRTVLIDEIFKKTLKRFAGQGNLGNTVNLMAVDSDQTRRLSVQGHTVLITLPLTIILSVYGLFAVLGYSAIVGLVLIILFIPISGYLGRIIVRHKKKLLKYMDIRVGHINEMLQGIRIVKFFAWEGHFMDIIEKVRILELSAIIKWWITRLAFRVIGSLSGILISLATLSFYTIYEGKTLNAATAFTALNLLGMVSEKLGEVPRRFILIFNAYTSISRIQNYFKEAEIENDKLDQYDENDEHLGFEDATFSYYGDQSNFKLLDLNIKFEKGGLNVISGRTGSGKTSTLLALLGELQCEIGKFWLPKQGVAFCSQSPWVLNTSIRENVCFGADFDIEKYKKIIRACALVSDLNMLEGGDLTEIGEKGINLSGGQKARICLARACYSDAQTIILDHPFSAVDAPTARYLFDNVINGLLKDRTIILATHNLSLVLENSATFTYLDGGKVLFTGHANDFKKLNILPELNFSVVVEEPVVIVEDFEPKSLGEGTTLVEVEKKATGRLSNSVYFYYISASGGTKFLMVFLFCFLLLSASKIGNTWWVKIWTDYNSSLPQFSSLSSWVSQEYEGDQTPFFVRIYALFGAAIIFTSSLLCVVYITGSYLASRSIHNELIGKILGAPLRFFEVTPSGRILNRFSSDMEKIDTQVMDSLQQFLVSAMQAITTVAVIGFIAPYFLVMVPLVTILYVYVANLYLQTSRELKRFESIARSPIYSLFSETITGVSVIRAYKHEDRFCHMNHINIDNNVRSRVPWIFTNRWLSLRTDILSSITVFAAGFAIAFGNFSPGLAGLTITYALQIGNAVLSIIREQADLELVMNSVERAKEYTDLEQESGRIIEGHGPPHDWPSRGEIVVEKLSVKYSPELPNVLKRISFTVASGEKVAVVGRTGAGKSTLSMAFFRILQITGGRIIIDDIDISSIGLFDLRSRLSIINQNPVLFSGTLRSNLDAFSEHDDNLLWDALNRVKFFESFQDSADLDARSLDFKVSQGGSNFSEGQRQLLCLARSLMLKKRIIFLDEATSNVDSRTDALIQKAIRTEFVNSSVITIAHRLSTIIDYDKIIVMRDGMIVETGKPSVLLMNDSVFRSMCMETGEFEELCEQASIPKQA